MRPWEYIIVFVLVFLFMTGAFFYSTSEENWNAGSSKHAVSK